MRRQLLPGLRITLLLTALTGLAYPGLVTVLCRLLFPWQAKGSLLLKEGRVVGSSLIGQDFTRPEYFQPRPSAVGFDAAGSGGSNLGPTSRKLVDRIQASVEKFRRENPDYAGPVPADLPTTSASGLDPHLSPASAEAQVARVAKARGLGVEQVREMVGRFTEGRDLGFLGEPGVNVLRLNLALDKTGVLSHVGHVSRLAGGNEFR